MPWKEVGYACEVQLLRTLINVVYKVDDKMGSSGKLNISSGIKTEIREVERRRIKENE
jgi:hypothetical protein